MGTVQSDISLQYDKSFLDEEGISLVRRDVLFFRENSPSIKIH